MRKSKGIKSQRVSAVTNTIITIDGPAGAGKSTVARRVARRLGYTYLDTGAMYRALTLKALAAKADLRDPAALIALAKNTEITFEAGPRGKARIALDGKDVSAKIRTPLVTENVFFIASIPGIRAVMVKLQRRIGKRGAIVVEGRDIGTVVFPCAGKKFYLDADCSERAQRRFKELREKKTKISLREVAHDVKRRDHSDLTRKVGPLKRAKDSVYIDTTHMSITKVVQEIIRKVGLRTKRHG